MFNVQFLCKSNVSAYCSEAAEIKFINFACRLFWRNLISVAKGMSEGFCALCSLSRPIIMLQHGNCKASNLISDICVIKIFSFVAGRVECVAIRDCRHLALACNLWIRKVILEIISEGCAEFKRFGECKTSPVCVLIAITILGMDKKIIRCCTFWGIQETWMEMFLPRSR